MSGKDDDPNEGLAADAALAEDLGDEEERRKEQLAYLGGEDDDIDSEDFSSADRGDSFEAPKDEDEDRGDEVDDDDDDDSDKDDKDDDDSDDSDDDNEDDDSDDDDSDDDDDDDENEDEDEDEDEDEEDPKGNKKPDQGIPRSRFNEVNERMKKAERELADLKNTDKAKEEAKEEKYDFDTAEEEYMALLLDGKTKEAGAKRREIREAEKEAFVAEAKSETKQEVSAEDMEKAVDALSKEAESMFPMFDETADDFNPAATRKVVVFMNGYMAEGMAPDDAFVAGLADVLEQYDVATQSQGDEDQGDEDTGENADKGEKSGKKKKTRKKKPINKNKEKLKDAEQQGQTPAGSGKGSGDAGVDAPDIEQMTDEELDALPPEKLARLRGDFVD